MLRNLSISTSISMFISKYIILYPIRSMYGIYAKKLGVFVDGSYVDPLIWHTGPDPFRGE